MAVSLAQMLHPGTALVELELVGGCSGPRKPAGPLLTGSVPLLAILGRPIIPAAFGPQSTVYTVTVDL